jgi:hypothetical protein
MTIDNLTGRVLEGIPSESAEIENVSRSVFMEKNRAEELGHLRKAEKEEVARIREALRPLGYYVYGVGERAMGSAYIEIHARVPNDEEWERLNAIWQRYELSS